MKIKQTVTPKIKQYAVRTLLIFTAVVTVLGLPAHAFANTIDDQIRQIESEVASYQAEAGRLRAEADTFQNAMNALTAQKNAIQALVNLSQAKYDKLVADIAANEEKLTKRQDVLASTISDLSQESTTSPIELLAGSNSIGDFIDRQEYRSSVQDQIQSSIKEIKELKVKLAKQKEEVEHVLADQKAQRDDMAAKEAEQANLLAVTQGQEAAYQGMIGQKSSQLSSLRAAQRAANARLGSGVTAGDPGRGGYPNQWYAYPYGTEVADSWGMYVRECVSYTAWKVHEAYLAGRGRDMPYWGGVGNAKQWPGNAENYGIPTGSEPRVGAVAVAPNLGPYGHVMWVEAVDGNRIYVSQFNYGVDGEYSEMWVSASGLVYIYF